MGSQDELTGKKFGEHWSGMDDDPAIDSRKQAFMTLVILIAFTARFAQPEGDEQEGEETPAPYDESSSGRSS
ncbi:hypothetical protein [Shimazuella kribbensis]|uniref:hypothetical protein n=1 Tax=Shimazuella kribbensis TaxID=139808 RepID=UPI00048FEE4C|nr:hypothetical protein [Shimazuella kribbensis]